jgi:hypothetical protein
MKKLLTIIFSILSFTLLAQSGSIPVTVLKSRVTDSTTAVNTSGWGSLFYNAQASPPLWEAWENGVKKKLFTQTYNGASPTTITVGGISAGTAISGRTYDWLWQNLLAPYVQPVYTSFSVTGQATIVEVGTTLSGSKTFTWGITPNSGTVPTIDVYDNTGSSTLLAGTPNDGTQAVTVTTRQLNSSGATQSWKGIGNNTSPSGTFNSSNFVVTAAFYQFYGPSASTPTNSAQVRALPSSLFYTSANTFILNTGTSQNKFDVALPPGISISQVIDLDALNAVITSQYVNTSTISVLDAGGTGRSYTLYEMNLGSAYSISHRHQITTN